MKTPKEVLASPAAGKEEFIALLRERKEEVEREMQRQNDAWRHEIQALDAVIAIYTSDGNPVNAPLNERRASTLSGRLRKFAIAEIKKAGRPLDRNEILQLAHNAGIVIDTKDPAKFLTRVLWRAKELINEGDGYRLAPNRPD